MPANLSHHKAGTAGLLQKAPLSKSIIVPPKIIKILNLHFSFISEIFF